MFNNPLVQGIASAIGVICIWSGYIVVSRAGVVTSLTAYDIAALRFMVAGLLVLPFLRAWWPRHLPLRAVALIAVCGPGAVYSLLMFLGLGQASAAYAGVFANGSLPIFTTVLAFVVAREVPSRWRVLAIAVIVAGGALVGWRGLTSVGDNPLGGIALFLLASAVLSTYILVLHRWQITPRQALALVNLPSALIYLPLWLLLLPSGLADADTSMIVLQALFQGLGPGFLALILFAVAANRLGPTPTAGFSACVPASAALLAIPVLGEVPTTLEWLGIGTVTLGLALLVARR